MAWSIRRTLAISAAGALCLAASVSAVAASAAPAHPAAGTTATPIKHVVVIFQENVSFDHYFGTYPNAANTDGQPFHAAANTPSSSTIDTTSIPAFIENNWLGGARTGPNSFDNIAGSIDDMFNFGQPTDSTLLLNPKTGEVLH